MTSTLTREKPRVLWEEMRENITIYCAAPLFGIAERAHNLRLATELRQMGYIVILPQEEAAEFLKGGKFNLRAVIENCAKQASQSKVVLANLDGPDADSGTSLETGIALWEKLGISSDDGRVHNLSDGITPLVICVRTDFRTAPEQEVGINGMFDLADGRILKPAFATSAEEIDRFYSELAQEIDAKIKSLWK